MLSIFSWLLSGISHSNPSIMSELCEQVLCEKSSAKHCSSLQIFMWKVNILPFSQILEPRFNGDTLAMLLNIPPQKTLLRRHLTTNFNVLIGPEAQQEKREIVESAAYSPLTTTAKVRVGTAVKRGQGEVNSECYLNSAHQTFYFCICFNRVLKISMQSVPSLLRRNII